MREFYLALRDADRRSTDSTVSALDRRIEQKFDLNDKALQAALLASKEAVTAALTAAKEAVDKAENAASKRFEATNEFRGQLADQASTFMARDLAAQQFSQIREELARVQSRLDTMQGSDAGAQGAVVEKRAVAQEGRAYLASMIAVATFVLGVLIYAFR